MNKETMCFITGEQTVWRGKTMWRDKKMHGKKLKDFFFFFWKLKHKYNFRKKYGKNKVKPLFEKADSLSNVFQKLNGKWS